MIEFNRPAYLGTEDEYVLQAMRGGKMSGDGPFAKKSEEWLKELCGSEKVLLTPSCTHALELAAMLLEIEDGDEVIMPSYTFVSTANAFVLRGAKIVFVDVRPGTMNLDESKVEAAITGRTRAVVPVHYAGVACNMDAIMEIAAKYGLAVVEDAAQAVSSRYCGRAAGGIGHLAAFSFHDTKNYTSGGEGGALLINDPSYAARAEIIREKGTNRSQYFRGMVDKYSWVDIGSSYLPGELQAAYLYAQLQSSRQIFEARMRSWSLYKSGLQGLAENGYVELPFVPQDCEHNAHMFYLKARHIDERTQLIEFLKSREITAAFHYVPLHTSPAGMKFSRFHGTDEFTTTESERLLRLPLWYGISDDAVAQVVNAVRDFYR